MIISFHKFILYYYNIRGMNFEEHEENTGWRPVFYTLPTTKSMAQKTIMPLGFFYSPFLA